MLNADMRDAVTIVDGVLVDLLATVPGGATGGNAAELRRAVGVLRSDIEFALKDGTLAARMVACFALARIAGASLGMADRMRRNIAALVPAGPVGAAVANGCMRFTLALMARIVAETAIGSRDDAEAMLARMNAAFWPAEDAAADSIDTATYRALVALHAAVTRDLVDRARPLPRMVTYAVAAATPSLALASSIYGDAARADELVAENKAIHPAFMPMNGRALSA